MNAQKIRFTDSSNKWILKVSQYFPGPHRWENRIENMQYDNKRDTIISGYTYKLLKGMGYSDIYVREDSATGKVYLQVSYYLSKDILLGIFYDKSHCKGGLMS